MSGHKNNKNIYAEILHYIFEQFKNVNIKKVKVGHEHGKNKSRCHLQAVDNFINDQEYS